LISSGGNWASYIAYIGALQIAITKGMPLIRAAGGVSRYYEDIVLLRRFEQEYLNIDNVSTSIVGRGEIAILGVDSNGCRVPVEGGSRTAMLSIVPQREVLFSLVGAVSSKDNRPIRSIFIRQEEDLDVFDSAYGIVCIDAKLMHIFEQHAHEKFFNAVGDRPLIIVYDSADDVGRFSEQLLLEVSSDKIEAAAAFGTQECTSLLDAFKNKAKTILAQSRNEKDDDDDDDDI
jgi:hypothetical protein